MRVKRKIVASSYLFPPDPVVKQLWMIVRNTGSKKPVSELARKSGLSPNTIYNLFNQTTRWPRNQTIDALLPVLGYRRVITKEGGDR